jgi:DNA-binding response OmpR family regulator
MPRVLIIAEDAEAVRQLATELNRRNFICSVSGAAGIDQQLTEQTPDLVLLETNHRDSIGVLSRVIRQKNMPVIALARLETISSLDGQLDVDDFVIKPYNVREIIARAKRLLHKNSQDNTELIMCGDLTIDTAKCEVAVAGSPKILTFKEYELLKFLASNPGRVFSRNTLLDRVWGRDYFGGDRTVDVHVRRLRSKIEDSGRCFIETVRNIGYRFSGSS